MRSFPEDHYCESLRGYKKPSPSSALRALAKRCQWLERKIALNTAIGKPNGFLVDELAALVMLVEMKMNESAFHSHLVEERGRTKAAGEVSDPQPARVL